MADAVPEYKAFVASLEQAPAAAEPEAEVVPDTTPLLDYLQKKQADDAARARKQREAAKTKKKGKPEMDKVVILKPVRKDDERPAQEPAAPAAPAPSKAPAKAKAKGNKDKDSKPKDPKPKDPKPKDPKRDPKPKDPPKVPKPKPEDGAIPVAKPTQPGVLAIPEAHTPAPAPGRGGRGGRRGRGRGRGRGT